MLKSLSPAKKQKIQQLLSAVSQIFSPAWDPFPPYQKLKQKMDRLKQMLNERAPSTLRPSGKQFKSCIRGYGITMTTTITEYFYLQPQNRHKDNHYEQTVSPK